MGVSISNPSYDRIYTAYAWRFNGISLNVTQGEGIEDTGVVWNPDGTIDQEATSQISITADHVKVPRFQLRDDRGLINPTGCQIVLAVKRPNGSEDLLACSIEGDAADGIISCPITRSVTAIEGEGLGEIRVISNNAIIKFYGINFNVHKGVSDEAAEQSTQFAALVSALQKVALVDPDGSNTVDMDTEVAENGTNPVASGVIYDFVYSVFNDGSKVSYETVTSPDAATRNGTIYYVNANTNKYIVIPVSAGAWQAQLRIDTGGDLYIRNRRSSDSEWASWKNISKDVDPAVVRSIIDEYINEHGITSGKSAYEVAVDNGYVGTEEQWLDSLKGAKGDSGLRGTSISRVRIDRGYLYVETSTPQEDGTEIVADGKIGYVVGENGRNGRNGRSVQSLSINDDGELISTIRVYDDYNNYNDMVGNLGRVVGADGSPGTKGDPGDDYVLTAADKNDIADLAAELINKHVAHINDAIDPTCFYLVEGVQNLNVIGTGPYRVFVVRTGNETSGTITQYILAKQGSDGKGHVYIRNGTISNGTITFTEGAEEIAKKADIPTQISAFTNNMGYQTQSEVAQKVSEGTKPFLYNDDYVVYTDGTVNPMMYHSSSNDALVNELYCSPVGQLDVTGWSQYTNLTTVYINAKESEIQITGTIPQGVVCYYREGTNSEYFLTENTVINALGALLRGKANKATTLAGYGIIDGENTDNKAQSVNRYSTHAKYPSAKAVYDFSLAACASGVGLSIYSDGTFTTNPINDGDVVKIYLPPTITTINMDFFRNKYQNLNTIYVENDSDAVTVTGDQTGISIMYKHDFVFENIIVNAISALTTQLKSSS